MTHFWEALDQVDQNQKLIELEYRLYYDDQSGTPLFYTTQDEPGVYIVIDKKTYNESRYDICIKNNKIVYIRHESIGKLVPGDSGFPTHPKDVTIVSNTTKSIYWKNKTYELD